MTTRAMLVESTDGNAIDLGKVVVMDTSVHKVRLFNAATDVTADIFGVVATKDPSINDTSYSCPLYWDKCTPYAYDDFLRYTFTSGGQNIDNPDYVPTYDPSTDPAVQNVIVVGVAAVLNGEPLGNEWKELSDSPGSTTKFYYIH